MMATLIFGAGPKENLHRPAINPLFRSAAVAHKDRVIGVVLSGQLDDGSTGLWWVKRYGGVTVIQDPTEAAYPDMPHHAQSYVDVDFVAGASEIGPLLTRLVNGAAENQLESPGSKQANEGSPQWKRSKV